MLFHAGKLKENLAVVVLEHLDVGRYHAVCVDTVAQHVGGGVVDAVFHLGLKGLGHGVIALARLDDRVEDNREVGSGVEFAVLLDEGTDIVRGVVALDDGVGGGQRAVECGIGVGVLHRAEHVGH